MARIRIGDLMVRAGLIDELQLNAALSYQRQWGGRLGDILVNQGFLDEMMLWRGLSKQLDVPLVSLPEMVISSEMTALLPFEICERLEVFPVMRDDRTLTVATSEPNNIGALDEVAFRTGLKVKTVLAPTREIEWAQRSYYKGSKDPCPPPRARRTLAVADPSPPLQIETNPNSMTPQTSFPSRTATPLSEVPRTAPPAPAGSLAPPQGVTQPPTASSTGGGASEEQHRQVVETLRAVIELCIARGVFTREELWSVLQNRR